MDKPRDPSSPAGTAGRFRSPPVVLAGFLLLLGLVFVGSYALGAAVGPIGPGPDPSSTTTTTPDTGSPHHGDHS
ncbi:hypothetical protein O1L60_36825 [Streptomyces diastatochromogenes]|nr:hypothetical protein [Streptomyces diastatochromogenes]